MGLVQGGYKDEDIRKILGGNVLRVGRAGSWVPIIPYRRRQVNESIGWAKAAMARARHRTMNRPAALKILRQELTAAVEIVGQVRHHFGWNQALPIT